MARNNRHCDQHTTAGVPKCWGFALAFLVLVAAVLGPKRGNGAETDSPLGSVIELRASREAGMRDWTLGAVPAGDLHFCNAGVDAPALLGTFQVGALFLTRSRAKAEPMSEVFSQGDGSLLLSSGDLDLGMPSGLDITAILRFGRSLGLETRYFGITGWSTSPIVRDPLNTGVRFEGFGTSIPFSAEQVDYASRLYSFEVNALPLVTEGVPVVLGFRTLQLHERFSLWQVDSSSPTLGLASKTNNYLYGFQVGAEPYLGGAGGPLRVDGLLKAGIYGNHASQGASSPLLGTSADANRNSVAFAGEVGIAVVYRFNRLFAIRGGYELLWLDHIALAPDQSRKTNLAASSAELGLGSALMHGASASIEFAF